LLVRSAPASLSAATAFLHPAALSLGGATWRAQQQPKKRIATSMRSLFQVALIHLVSYQPT